MKVHGKSWKLAFPSFFRIVLTRKVLQSSVSSSTGGNFCWHSTMCAKVLYSCSIFEQFINRCPSPMKSGIAVLMKTMSLR